MENKERIYFVVLFSITFFSRLLLIDTNSVVVSDELDYVTSAQNIASGLGFSTFTLEGYIPETYRMPLLPFLLSPVSYSLLHMKTMMVFLSSALVLVTYILVRKLLNSEIAFLTAVIVSFNSYILDYSIRMMTESLFSLLLMLSLFFYIKIWKNNNLKYYAMFGFFSGLFSLTRYNGVLTFVLMMVLVLYSKKKSDMKKILISIIFFFIVMSPLLFRNFVLFGNPMFISGQGVALWIGNNPQSMEGGPEWVIIPEINEFNGYSVDEINSFYSSMAFDYIMSDIPSFFYRSAIRFFENWYATVWMISPMFFVFFVFGLASSMYAVKKYSVFYLVLLFNYLIFSFVLVSLRYLIPFIPIVSLFAAFGFRKIFARYKRAGILVFLSLILVVVAFSVLELRNQPKYLEFQEAGEYISGKTEQPIIARGEIGFYSGLESVSPIGNFTLMVDSMRMYGIEYLLVDSRYSTNYYPNLGDLSESELINHDLAIEHIAKVGDYKVTVLRLIE